MTIVHVLASTETAPSGGTRRVAGLEFTTETPRFVRDPPAAILNDPFLVRRPSSEAEAKEAGAEVVTVDASSARPLRLGRRRAAQTRSADGLQSLGAVLGRIADALEAQSGETGASGSTSSASRNPKSRGGKS